MPSGSWPYPTSIAFANQNDGIFLVTNWTSPGPPNYYKMLETNDGGNNWTEMNFPLSINPAFICSIPGTLQGYLVTAPADTIGTAYTLDGGNSWQSVEDTVGLVYTKFASGSTGWALNWEYPTVFKWSGPPFPVAVEEATTLPKEFALEQNYPNPFNPSTCIQYAVSSRQFVILKVYDILGNEIETLVSEEKSVGTYEITWNAENLPSGVYFYQMRAVDPESSSGQGFINTKKMILLK
jgi:hypothetical protein